MILLDQFLKFNNHSKHKRTVPKSKTLLEKTIANLPEEENRYAEHSMDIAYLLKQHMKKNKISEKEMTGKLEITPGKIKKWLSGTTNFSIAEISRIEVALEIEIIPFVKIGSRKKAA